MTDTVSTCLHAARAELQRARSLLNRQIAAYPTPISGCDAQFNHLVAERQKVSRALTCLDSEVFVPTPRTLSPGSGVESR